MIIEEVKNGVVKFNNGYRCFSLDKENLEIRIKNLKMRGIQTEIEFKALAEINRQEKEAIANE
ncbi:hypothetical protein [Methylocucumis oryzae]|uniref:Uncharacterized protein n=1 Tax=Methylocucumis oryzae TaxID=1632867 RepID=A0A0F3INE1_9GAMM|nr:hypothetical protein [Methylocucumis oryzae]KJV08078.1 hypothetical protein VZ94_00530 [Methylocucumis oryzae]